MSTETSGTVYQAWSGQLVGTIVLAIRDLAPLHVGTKDLPEDTPIARLCRIIMGSGLFDTPLGPEAKEQREQLYALVFTVLRHRTDVQAVALKGELASGLGSLLLLVNAFCLALTGPAHFGNALTVMEIALPPLPPKRKLRLVK